MLHAVPDPDPIIKAAGTRMATEWSLQHEHGRSTDLGSTRTQHQLRIDPNEVRSLTEGMAFVIGHGRAQKVQIAPPPRGIDLPRGVEVVAEPEPIDDNAEPEGPVQL
jgi:hypothetical protein